MLQKLTLRLKTIIYELHKQFVLFGIRTYSIQRGGSGGPLGQTFSQFVVICRQPGVICIGCLATLLSFHRCVFPLLSLLHINGRVVFAFIFLV